MSNAVEEIYSDISEQNPISCVEDVLADNNWVYSRMNNNELIVDVAGSVFSYRICFVWQENMNSMQVICQMDTSVNEKNRNVAAETLMEINRSMWLGHFELTKSECSPCLRYTCLLQDCDNASKTYINIQNIVDICLAQCEQHQNVFQILSSDELLDLQMLSLAMMDTAGES